MRFLLFCGAILIAGSALAHDQGNCRAIDNQLERLACYDQDHAEPVITTDNLSGAEAIGQIPVEEKIIEQAAGKTEITGRQLSESPTTGEQVALEPEEKSSITSIGFAKQVFSKHDKTSIKARISEVKKRPRQRTSFVLDNGQIWRMENNKLISARAGDSVQIKPGSVGGYRLRVNDGAAFRVERIQ